jgi:hypothetical protein
MGSEATERAVSSNVFRVLDFADLDEIDWLQASMDGQVCLRETRRGRWRLPQADRSTLFTHQRLDP